MIAYWTCSYLPRELPEAFGPETRRFWAQPGTTPRADRLLPVSLCSSVRASLEEALRIGQADDLFLLVDCCDADRRLADALEASFPGRVILLFLPHSEDRWVDYASELERLAAFLEVRCGRQLSTKALQEAISLGDRVRLLLRRWDEYRRAGRCSSSHSYQVLHAWNTLPFKEAEVALEGLLEMDRAEDTGHRVMLLGNSLDDPAVWRAVEAAGFMVVADDLCYGEKQARIEPELNGKPLQALARAYLERQPCPRMLQLEERWRLLLEEAHQRQVEGVIFAPTKYCDYYAYELPTLGLRMRQAGIPMLVLEIDYSQPAEGQLRTRLEAFSESL